MNYFDEIFRELGEIRWTDEDVANYNKCTDNIESIQEVYNKFRS